MKFTEIENWSKTLDQLEDDLADHIEPEIPDLEVGDIWKDPEERVWREVAISYGKVGGRWCYWRFLDSPQLGIVVDSIFNGWSPRFAGMLRIPYDGAVKESLMLVRSGTQS